MVMEWRRERERRADNHKRERRERERERDGKKRKVSRKIITNKKIEGKYPKKRTRDWRVMKERRKETAGEEEGVWVEQ